MSQYTDYSEWPAKAEPASPYVIDDNAWLLCDNLDSNDGIYKSLPLSLIQEDKDFNDDIESIHEIILSDSYNNFEIAYESDDSGGQLVPSIKYEEISSPPYSPIQSPGSTSPNDKIARAQLASKLLDDLDNLKEERFPEWFEEKADLPIFPEFSPPGPLDAPVEYQPMFNESITKTHPEILPQIYHLTPPQSPPQLLGQPDPFSIWPTNATSVESSSDTYNEVALVDAFVLHAVQNIAWQEPQNPHLEEMKSVNFVSNFELSENNFKGDNQNSDSNLLHDIHYAPYSSPVSEERSPSSCSPSSPSSSSCSSFGSSENVDEWVSSSEKARKPKSRGRSKPYSRSSDDKKSRKKEQNKNAATRYRQKKKAEIEILMGEEKELQTVHDELSTKYSDLRKEVATLKKFLREIFQAKGILK